MIVVEGFDGSGKTTLSQLIAESIGWPVYHTGGPTRDLADVHRCLHRSALRYSEHCIQDRCTHISESVYSMMTKPDQASIALARLEAVGQAKAVIYCRPHKDVLLQSIRTHAVKTHETQAHVRSVIENADALIGIYDTVMALVEQTLPIRRFDFKADSAHNLIQSIKGDLK